MAFLFAIDAIRCSVNTFCEIVEKSEKEKNGQLWYSVLASKLDAKICKYPLVYDSVRAVGHNSSHIVFVFCYHVNNNRKTLQNS